MQKLWTTPVHVHIAIATEVIQLSHFRQQACFISVEVWRPSSILLCCHSIAWSCCSKPDLRIHQQIFESSSTQTSYPVLCTCKMVQGSGRYHLESVGLCFVGDDLPFSGGFCFASVCIAGSCCCRVILSAQRESYWFSSESMLVFV